MLKFTGVLHVSLSKLIELLFCCRIRLIIYFLFLFKNYRQVTVLVLNSFYLLIYKFYFFYNLLDFIYSLWTLLFCIVCCFYSGSFLL